MSDDATLYALPLHNGTTLRGFLIIAGTDHIDDTILRIMQHLAPALAGMIPMV